ncbi:group 1 glycosyl transferase [Mycolicibacterium gilvum]|uniref:Group 1 glycosyl transferase n=1 Tax=Mycolicibacterium gilvum TaxID=1804 RepID=A0A378SK47_9MYCO|nr:group 1 glycosyl transferase [Mycolicibacterium gilvum]
MKPRKPRLIIWVQDIYTLGLEETGEGGGLAAWVTRRVEGATLRSADKVVVIHDRFADYLRNELAVESRKIAVIRNWAHLPDRDVVDSSEAKSALGWPVDTTLAVHTGNMGAKQGLENIIEAARLADAENAPVHFILVGDGSERQKLCELARGISRLTFVGSLNDESYSLALSAADILLVNEKPGVAAMAVPSKLTSYFHAGRPVVAATDSEGISASEVFASGAGVVVPAGQPRLLLEKILAMRENPEIMAEFGSNGRLYRQAILGRDAAIQRWSELLTELLTANDGGDDKTR